MLCLRKKQKIKSEDPSFFEHAWKKFSATFRVVHHLLGQLLFYLFSEKGHRQQGFWYLGVGDCFKTEKNLDVEISTISNSPPHNRGYSYKIFIIYVPPCVVTLKELNQPIYGQNIFDIYAKCQIFTNKLVSNNLCMPNHLVFICNSNMYLGLKNKDNHARFPL